MIERKVESSLEQANVLKGFCDWRNFDKLEITQFADFIIIMPKGQTIEQFMKYWEIHSQPKVISND